MADCMQEWSEPVVRVQALAESGLPAIPRRYVKPPCDRPAVQEQEPSDDISIPVIDLGELLADGAGLGNVTEAVAAACREWGFFQVVNHGVRPELMRAAREAWRSFFRLSVTEKQQYANSPRTYEGYGSRLGVEKGAILDWGDYYFLHLAPESAKSPAKYWPANPGNCNRLISTLILVGERIARVNLCSPKLERGLWEAIDPMEAASGVARRGATGHKSRRTTGGRWWRSSKIDWLVRRGQ